MNERNDEKFESVPDTEGVAEAATPEEVSFTEFDGEKPLDKNVRLLSPGRMVARRFFRSKLSIIGLVLIIGLLVFSWFGPVVYNKWGETETDNAATITYEYNEITVGEGDDAYTYYQVIERTFYIAQLAPCSPEHPLGTDKTGMDVLTQLMYGGRISLTVSFLAVFVTTFLGIVFGGIAGYFGGKVDNIIMRFCDILMCLPGLPIMLIVGTLAEGMFGIDPVTQQPIGIPNEYRIYFLMGFLSLISWGGTARLVRGQILFLREQEYMVAAEAMGYSTTRKIFKHLLPNVLPQIIVSMTLSLGSMILYEATLSYLNLGVPAPNAAWGTMINIISRDSNVLQNNFNVWGPPGICIILAVLGFNFLGDGLRDALDPKMRR